MQNLIDDLNWRYATKEFDSSKKLTTEQLNTLLESLETNTLFLWPTAMEICPSGRL